jgi:hypothetical protein
MVNSLIERKCKCKCGFAALQYSEFDAATQHDGKDFFARRLWAIHLGETAVKFTM